MEVDVEEVEYIRSLRFSWKKIAEIIGISRRTLYRRLNEWNVPIDIKYSTITDENLDSLVADIKRSYPTYGEVLLRSHLITLGVNIQRSRLRACIHRIDPYTIELRRRETVRRLVYSVESPNSLWHIDGNHKLIRWKLVVHGGIDGKTRTIVFLNCSPNNCASTVFHHFQSAVAIYGIPDRIRSDKGGENIDVWRYMYHFHGNAAAAIAGLSTHNEHIERLWRDVYHCVSSNYYELFYHMEEQQELDPLNEIDLYCLHFIYLQRINKNLQDFSESWNHHALSTEQNQTPYQLLLLRLRSNQCYSQHLAVSASLPPGVNVTQHVQVPRSKFIPWSTLLSLLHDSIDPLQDCSDFGYRLYLAAVTLVGQHLQTSNNCTCAILE